MDLDELENLQRQINVLAEQLQQSRAQLSYLQEKLNSAKAQNISVQTINQQIKPVATTSSNLEKSPHFRSEQSALENFIGLKIINLVF